VRARPKAPRERESGVAAERRRRARREPFLERFGGARVAAGVDEFGFEAAGGDYV
jgi:hypothetical protein